MVARAPINGATLRWAREVLWIEPQELARTCGVTEARLAAFESGDAQPTMRQLQKLASKLDRTLAFFFTDPPETSDVPTGADFRAGGAKTVPSVLAREMRRANQHRDVLLELSGPVVAPALVGALDRSNVQERACELRSALGLTMAFTPPETVESQVFGFWRGLLEQNGVLVFQVARVGLDVFRGLAIHHEVLPIIVINGADSNNGKVFTLFHEVGHLVQRTSGLCNLADDVAEEALVNEFAACFLMPEPQVRGAVAVAPQDLHELVSYIAREFKVSVIAAGVRLRRLGVISTTDLADVWVRSENQWARQRRSLKTQEGGPPYWRIRYRDLGHTYVGAVARALDDGHIDWLDASYHLNVRVPTAQHMIEEFHRTGAEK